MSSDPSAVGGQFLVTLQKAAEDPAGRAVFGLNQAQGAGDLPSRRYPPSEIIDLTGGRGYASHMSHLDRITIEDGKRGGKPCIRGLRITVYDVLEYLASGMTETEILADFPDLEADDIRACLEFAADRERKMVSAPSP